MGNKYILIKYCANWADDFDVEGHIVITKEKYHEFLEKLESIEEFSFMFGTNQDIDYFSNEALKCDLTFSSISNSEYEIFKKFNILQVGFVPYYEIINYSKDEY